MTHGLKPTEEQKKLIIKAGYDATVWNVWKDEAKVLIIVNKINGNRKSIIKEG